MPNSFLAAIPADPDLSARCRRLQALVRVLDGTLYDHLPHDFHTEKNEAGEYVSLRDRRPSVRYALCKTVVDDAVSLLFSAGHFPALTGDDADSLAALNAIIRDCRLNEVMIDAATRGSIGSVALRLRILGGRPFVDALSTVFLTPEWRPEAPDTLLRVTEQYKVKGAALRDSSYTVDEAELGCDFWFRRVWDAESETWYEPWPVAGGEPRVDTGRSLRHGLGFVPLVWIRNLPGGDAIDGICTFAAAIDTSIEIDYLLSQAGRGLKYSADPTLLIKEPALGNDGQQVRGAANAIVVAADGDARLLEINGNAAEAVVAYVRCLRELALESVHGNRAAADRLSAAQSGRAMELMHQALIWLADRLRVSYGEGGLLELLHLIVRAAQLAPLHDRYGRAFGEIRPDCMPGLRWPAWYEPTVGEQAQRASLMTALCEAGLVDTAAAAQWLQNEVGLPATSSGTAG